jgi:hypothetical protein
VHGKILPPEATASVYLKVVIKFITLNNFWMIICPPDLALKNKKGQTMHIKAL